MTIVIRSAQLFSDYLDKTNADNALVSAVADLVQLQMKDLQHALHGAGNFLLIGPFARHHVSYQCWVSMSDDRRTAAFRRFLSDTGNRQPPVHVQASDGGLTVLNATRVARKPGQRKRPRAAGRTYDQQEGGMTVGLMTYALLMSDFFGVTIGILRRAVASCSGSKT